MVLIVRWEDKKKAEARKKKPEKKNFHGKIFVEFPDEDSGKKEMIKL